jgi:ribosomal subunit interface protein
MQTPDIKVKSSGIEYTEKLATYVEKKIRQLDKLIPENAKDALYEIELGKATKHHKTGKIFRAEINLSYGSTLHRAVAEDTKIEYAVDAIKEELKAEITKSRTKKKEAARKCARGAKKIAQGG